MKSFLAALLCLMLAEVANGECRVQDKTDCPGWAKSGYCHSSSVYHQYMTKNCPRACGLCGKGGNGGNGGNECRGQDKTDCPGWANSGYCHSSSVYHQYMTKNCPRACGLCGKGGNGGNGGNECRGQDKTDCPGWAKSGYCHSSSVYHQYMTKNCPRACGLCGKGGNGGKGGNAQTQKGPRIFNVNVNACLGAHNYKRYLHNTPKLYWDAKLAAESAKYALWLARNDVFKHGKSGYGENLYASTGKSASKSCEEAVGAWYDEIRLYNYGNPGFSMATGHFTQVVWKSTTHVGVGVATAIRNGVLKTYVVARYNPPGNVMGAFKENVLPKVR